MTSNISYNMYWRVVSQGMFWILLHHKVELREKLDQEHPKGCHKRDTTSSVCCYKDFIIQVGIN